MYYSSFIEMTDCLNIFSTKNICSCTEHDDCTNCSLLGLLLLAFSTLARIKKKFPHNFLDLKFFIFIIN